MDPVTPPIPLEEHLTGILRIVWVLSITIKLFFCNLSYKGRFSKWSALKWTPSISSLPLVTKALCFKNRSKQYIFKKFMLLFTWNLSQSSIFEAKCTCSTSSLFLATNAFLFKNPFLGQVAVIKCIIFHGEYSNNAWNGWKCVLNEVFKELEGPFQSISVFSSTLSVSYGVEKHALCVRLPCDWRGHRATSSAKTGGFQATVALPDKKIH